MDKLTNTSINKVIDASLKARSGTVLEDNEKLIEKLEMAYRDAPEKDLEIDEKQFYGMSLGTINLLIDNNVHSELHEDCSVHRIPLVAGWILGVANIRGDIVPVIDLEKIITGNSSNQKSDTHKVIIINKGKDAVGLLINQFPKPISLHDDEINNDYTNVPKSIHAYIEHAYIHDNATWICIDFPSFIQSITH